MSHAMPLSITPSARTRRTLGTSARAVGPRRRRRMVAGMRALSALLPLVLAAAAGAADRGAIGAQLLIGQEQGVQSDVRDFTDLSRGWWIQGSIQTAVTGTTAPTWLDFGARLHAGERGDVRVFSLCFTDRAPFMGPIGLTLGGGLAGGFVDSEDGRISRDGWSPMIQAGLNADLGGGLVVEALWQYLPRDIGGLDADAFTLGAGLRF